MSGEELKGTRALRLYDLALSILNVKGRSLAIGPIQVRVYRDALLTIRHWPVEGNLEVWFGRKVLAIDTWGGMPHVINYTSGEWERQLEAAVNGTA